MKTSTAVILAAGRGTRFGDMTSDIPKGFIPFKGKAMVERSIRILIDQGITRIIIGTGYHAEQYEALALRYPQIETVFSPAFAQTNSMATLQCCRHAIGQNPFLLLESDIIYEPLAVRELLDSPHPDIMLISPVTKFQDQYYVEADPKGNLRNCSTDKGALTPDGELVGIHKISPTFFSAMTSEYETVMEKEPSLGYEFQILRTATTKIPMHVLSIQGLKWYEIDDASDLEYAERHVEII